MYHTGGDAYRGRPVRSTQTGRRKVRGPYCYKTKRPGFYAIASPPGCSEFEFLIKEAKTSVVVRLFRPSRLIYLV